MIPRYSLPEMASLWSDESRFSTWLEVEILAVEAWSLLGTVSADDVTTIRERTAGMVTAADVAEIEAREQITNHDVAAFVDVVAGRVGQPAGGWVHYGLTSSDVTDTALSLTLSRAATLLVDAASALEGAIAGRARELRDLPMVGRTHGIHAEPTTMGAKMAVWALQIRRDRERLVRARHAISVGKLSGAVGTYSNVDPAVERYVCQRLGLRPVPATQVLARDRHAEFAYACASVAASVEAFALEIRHLQRTEVGEAAEPFRRGAQKGSSAMPHKRNPVRCEQMCGLARVVRANLVPALEDVALWHERDISHSSVERVILPDSSMLAYYLLVKFTEIVEGLEVFPERMAENLERSYGLVFSQPVLLALVASGLDRDAAYRIVQGSAMAAWEERRPFSDILRENPEVTSRLSDERLAACFDLKAALANAGRVFDAL
ncbi:MAG TPA: adenylosuccinate lyase, partial [Acidimicrobiia bacterium]|nr:adenylosuccinate lyase [Acidimicrobiia bacterium]